MIQTFLLLSLLSNFALCLFIAAALKEIKQLEEQLKSKSIDRRV